MNPKVKIPLSQLSEICRRYHIQRLALFGSALRDDFSPDSDIDLLYDVEPGQSMGYITLGIAADEMSQALGREVDLVRRGALHPYIRDGVLAEAEVIYEG